MENQTHNCSSWDSIEIRPKPKRFKCQVVFFWRRTAESKAIVLNIVLNRLAFIRYRRND